MTNARGLLQFLLGLLFLVVAGLALYAGWLEPSSLRISVYSVSQPAPALKGLRVAVISDLHGGSLFIDEAKIKRMVAMTNAAKPDLVLLTGDYMITGVVAGRYMPIESMAEQLRHLRAPLGVYAVLGNHDHWDDAGHIIQVFRKAGIPILENRNVRLPAPRHAVALAGIGDLFTGHALPKESLAGVDGPAICFSHSPDTFPVLPGNCALTIAGHTHGGQIWLPFLGRPGAALVSRYGQKYAFGEVHEQGRTLFVSPGIGTSLLPLRFGVPPEVSLLMVR